MSQRCPACNELNTDANRFCENCGAKLVVPEAQKPKVEAATAPAPAVTIAPQAPPAQPKPKPTAPKKPSVPAEKPAGPLLPSVNLPALDWERCLYIILILIGIVSRFYDLGYKELHHDESIHALNSYTLFKGGGFHYDPGYHGPMLYHINALVYFLFGASDYTARMAPAFVGLLLIGFPYLMRDVIGRTAALVLAFLITFSPTFLYVSRFIRHDIYLALGTLGMAYAFFKFRKDAKPLYVFLFSMFLAICFTNMESTYLHVSIFFPFLLIMYFWDASHQSSIAKVISQYNESFKKAMDKEGSYMSLGLILLVIVLACAFLFWPNWQGYKGAPGSMLGDFGNYVAVADQKGRNEGFMYGLMKFLSTNPTIAVWLVGLGVPALLTVTFYGLAWYTKSFKTAFYSYLIFFIIFIPFFTTMIFGNPHGLFDGFVRSLTYWLSQQPVSRGDEPWYYYYALLSMYEQGIVFFTIVGFIVFTAFKRSVLTTFAMIWVIGAFTAYVHAAEKMPWITIHMLLPMTFLSALTIAYFLENAHWVFKSLTLALCFLFFILSVHNAVLLAYINPANPVEPMVYVQSTPHIRDIMGTINRLSERLSATDPDHPIQGGKNMEITCEDLCSWPFAWYLREYKNLDYPTPVRVADRPVILTCWQTGQTNGVEHDTAVEKLCAGKYHRQKYKLRAWWGWTDTPDWDLDKYFQWLFYRQPWSSLGSQDMVFWVRNDLWEQSQ